MRTRETNTSAQAREIIIKFGNRPERASEAVDKGPLINSMAREREKKTFQRRIKCSRHAGDKEGRRRRSEKGTGFFFLLLPKSLRGISFSQWPSGMNGPVK